MAATLMMMELYLIFALSSRPHEVPFYLPLFIVFIIYLMWILSASSIPKLLLYIAGAWLVASIPVFGAISTMIRSGSSTASGTGSTILFSIGVAGFVALLILGVIALVTYLKQRANPKEQAEPELLTAAIFVFVASAMAVLLLIGVRGYSAFLFLSVILMGGLGLLLWKHIRWPVLIAIAGICLVMIGIYPFIWGMVIGAVVVLILGIGYKVAGWRAALLVIVMAFAGFSVHYFLWVRSAQKPYINENNPSQSWDQMRGFLERKQYGSQSMTERMFVRRGAWENQFGTYRRMGYWGFFQEQYGVNGRAFFSIFVIGVLGLWEAIRRRSELGLTLALLIIVSSIGLVLYMNFADGTRQDPMTGEDYLEVRDRDYFFTPAYVLFGLAIGMGITALVQYIREAMAHFSGLPKRVVQTSLLVLFLLPTFALARNYYECDRSNNWIAHDYAKSLLSSADKNAAFFVYGDNDTFPLWCLQEAYKYRKDVRMVNLSLANTKWYIKQVQESMGLDLGMTEKQIDDMRPYRTQDGRTFYLNNQVVDAVIENNARKVPINFSVTVAAEGRKFQGKPIDPYLTITGLSWRLREDGNGMRAAVDEALDFFLDTTRFQMRGIFDSTIYKDDNQLRLLRNYSNAMIMIADSLRKAKRLDEGIRLLEYGYQILPLDNELVNYLAGMYTEVGREDGLRSLMEKSSGGDPKWLAVMLGRQLRSAGKFQEAETTLNQVFLANPTYRAAYEELCMLYNEQRNYRSLRTTFEIWLKANPKDSEAAEMLMRLDEFLTAQGKPDSAK
jgi:tetratricopeptide (TPR) repeat protein